MNPSSPEKIQALGSRLRLNPALTVLDIGCGTGGPAVLLAARYGCRVLGVDHHLPFVEKARARAEDAGVTHLVQFVVADGADFIDNNVEAFDVALCIGAAWILGGFATSAHRLRSVVPDGGHVVIGDTYRRGDAPLSDGSLGRSLPELVARMADSGFAPVGVFAASADDWNTYTSLKWLSIEDWLEDNPDHPETTRFRDRDRGSDLAQHQDGWALVAGRRISEG